MACYGADGCFPRYPQGGYGYPQGGCCPPGEDYRYSQKNYGYPQGGYINARGYTPGGYGDDYQKPNWGNVFLSNFLSWGLQALTSAGALAGSGAIHESFPAYPQNDYNGYYA